MVRVWTDATDGTSPRVDVAIGGHRKRGHSAARYSFRFNQRLRALPIQRNRNRRRNRRVRETSVVNHHASFPLLVPRNGGGCGISRRRRRGNCFHLKILLYLFLLRGALSVLVSAPRVYSPKLVDGQSVPSAERDAHNFRRHELVFNVQLFQLFRRIVREIRRFRRCFHELFVIFLDI